MGQVRASWPNKALNPRVVPAQQNGSDAAVGSAPEDRRPGRGHLAEQIRHYKRRSVP